MRVRANDVKVTAGIRVALPVLLMLLFVDDT
jgi:hypothetical protein